MAAHLGVSLRTVRRLVASGDLGVLRIGRSVRVSPPDLEAFLARSAAARGA